MDNKLRKQIIIALRKAGKGKIDITDFLSKIDLDLMINLRDTYSKEAMIKALILRELNGLKFEASLADFLKDIGEDALKLGFFRGDGGKVMIPDRRTFSHFLKHRLTNEDKNLLDFVVNTVKEITEKFDIPLQTRDKPKEKAQNKITEEDKISKTKQIRKNLYPLIDLEVNGNAKHTKNQILDTLSYVASVGKCTNGGAISFEKIKTGSPKPYTILRHVKRNKIGELMKKMDKILEKQFKEINKTLRIKAAKIAIDETLIPFYDRGNGSEGKSVYDFVVGGPEKASTFNFIKYLTADIIHPKVKFTLAIVPRRPGILLVDDIRELVHKVRKLVGITLLLADRGFNDNKIFKMLDEEGIKYLMPLAASKGVKKLLNVLPINSVQKDFEYGSEGYKIPYFVYVEGKKGPMKIATSIKINKDDMDFIKSLPEQYSKRWTIETGYRDKKRNAFARTTSTDYVVRLFYFAFSVMLYNAWNSVKFLLVYAIDAEETRKKVISLFAFIQKLYGIEIT
jgi:hypothetical protein